MFDFLHKRREVEKTRIIPHYNCSKPKTQIRCRVYSCRFGCKLLIADRRMKDMDDVELWLILKYKVPMGQLADLEALGRCWWDCRLFEVEL
jgi:hypothetical protein